MTAYDGKGKGLVSRPKKKVFLAELVLTSLFKCDNQSKALMKNKERAEEDNWNSSDFVLNNALLPAETIADENANFTLDKARWNALRAARHPGSAKTFDRTRCLRRRLTLCLKKTVVYKT